MVAVSFDFPRVIAHRGASHYAPENTQAAFELAAKMGAKMVEVDLHLTKDHNIAIIHDPSVNKCTNGTGKVLEMTTEELSALDAGSWFSDAYQGQKVLMLAPFIELLTRLDLTVNLELKPIPDFEIQLATIAQQIIKQYWPANKPWPLFSSFSVVALEAIREVFPEAPRGLLLDKWQKNSLAIAQDLECCSVNLSKQIVTAKNIEQIKAVDKKILVYTVNQKEKAQTLFNIGVDGVFTDCPDLILSL
jgi:glycerophosphoryl diester phosphodiesterase